MVRPVDDKKREINLKPGDSLPQEKVRQIAKEAVSKGKIFVDIRTSNLVQLQIVRRLVSAIVDIAIIDGMQRLPNGQRLALTNGSIIQMVSNAVSKAEMEAEEPFEKGTE